MTNEIINQLDELKAGLFSEVLKKIEKVESDASVIHFTDLKLHHASYYTYELESNGILTDKQAEQLFSEICEREYDFFAEWEKENLNYVERSYIGRTSSFYYDSNWYGDEIDNGYVDTLLEGKSVDLNIVLGGMSVIIHDYLFNGDTENISEIDSDDIESEMELLERLSNDLDTVQEIVNEALKAYEYLKEFKTEANEKSLVDSYIEHEITEYYGEASANEYFDLIIYNIEKLNKVESIIVKTEVINNNYMFLVNVNGTNKFNLNTKINYESKFSKLLVDSILSEIKKMIDNKFEL